MKLAIDQIKEKLKRMGYNLLNNNKNDTVYKNNKLYVHIEDNNGYKYFVSYHTLDGNPPFIVHVSNPYSLENFSLWLKLNHKEFELSNDNTYIKSSEKLKFYCYNCNNYFYMNSNNIFRGHECGVCTGHKVEFTTSLGYLMPDLSKEWVKSENNLIPYNVTKSSHESVYWKCFKCGHKWWATVDSRSRGNGCQNCANQQNESKIATKLKQYILENYKSEVEYKILKNPKTNRFLPYDVYIYDNIYIEIHGEQHYIYRGKKDRYYKSQEEFEYRQSLDQLKKDYAQNNGKYIEVDLRQIKTIEDAINYIENKIW